MIPRRTALRAAAALGGVGIVGVGAQFAGVLDDGLRAVGVRPHAEPDPQDTDLVARAALDQEQIVGYLDAVGGRHDVRELSAVRAVLVEQWAAVDDTPVRPGGLGHLTPPEDRSQALDQLADLVESAAAARADGALDAESLAVIKVLAAMAAGLDQVAVAVRRLA